MPEALNIISQIATGMKYLHDNEVVHGDLKPKNVLLCPEAGEMKVKVTDFGLVETKKRIKLVSKRSRHFEILMWKAPELFSKLLGPVTEDSDDPFTDSDTDLSEDEEIRGSEDFLRSKLAMADVYSFGLTCSHILGAKVLYPDLSLTKLRIQRLDGFRPDLPSTCPEYLKALIYSSLESEPLSRPTFSAICALKVVQPIPSKLMAGVMDSMKGAIPHLPDAFSCKLLYSSTPLTRFGSRALDLLGVSDISRNLCVTSGRSSIVIVTGRIIALLLTLSLPR